MSLHIYRVTVRGHFSDLDDATQEALRRDAEDHSIFRSAYTAAGTFTYEPDLIAFNFRYEVRARGEDAQTSVEQSARAMAVGYLVDAGIGYKHLRVDSIDMADMWSD